MATLNELCVQSIQLLSENKKVNEKLLGGGGYDQNTNDINSSL